jgi:hypothetical protein
MISLLVILACLVFISLIFYDSTTSSRRYSGTSAPGSAVADVFDIDFYFPRKAIIKNITRNVQDDVTYEPNNNGKGFYDIFGATNTGITKAFEIPGFGFFALSNKLGTAGTQIGIITCLAQKEFNYADMAGNSYAFFSFTPYSASVNFEGIQMGIVPFQDFAVGTAPSFGTNRTDLTQRPQKLLKIQAQSYVNGAPFINNESVPIYIASPNDFPPGAVFGTLRGVPPQDGATAFATPSGFASDYPNAQGCLYGVSINDLVPFNLGSYIYLNYRSEDGASDAISDGEVVLSAKTGGFGINILPNFTFSLSNQDSGTPPYTYSYRSGTEFGRIWFTKFNFALLGQSTGSTIASYSLLKLIN